MFIINSPVFAMFFMIGMSILSILIVMVIFNSTSVQTNYNINSFAILNEELINGEITREEYTKQMGSYTKDNLSIQ